MLVDKEISPFLNKGMKQATWLMCQTCCIISSEKTSIHDVVLEISTFFLFFSFVISQEERDLVAKGRFDALIEHQRRTDVAIEEEV